MRLAEKKDKDLVISILLTSFEKIHGVGWMFRKYKSRKRQLRRLLTYAFYRAYFLNGVYISDNGKGVALCFMSDASYNSILPFIYKMIFLITSVRISAIPKLGKLEASKKTIRPIDKPYLYFWFFAVLKGGAEAGFELKNAMIQKATTLKIPLYAETAIRRNKVVYERYGFKTYHEIDDPKEKLHLWFMKWESDC